jgi:hypothetical protein
MFAKNRLEMAHLTGPQLGSYYEINYFEMVLSKVLSVVDYVDP